MLQIIAPLKGTVDESLTFQLRVTLKAPVQTRQLARESLTIAYDYTQPRLAQNHICPQAKILTWPQPDFSIFCLLACFGLPTFFPSTYGGS